MTRDEASSILGMTEGSTDGRYLDVVRSAYGLDGDHLRVQWPAEWPKRNWHVALLDGYFTADELEAIAVYMRAHQGESE